LRQTTTGIALYDTNPTSPDQIPHIILSYSVPALQPYPLTISCSLDGAEFSLHRAKEVLVKLAYFFDWQTQLQRRLIGGFHNPEFVIAIVVTGLFTVTIAWLEKVGFRKYDNYTMINVLLASGDSIYLS